ncbi:caspase, EACC1-associated type [Nodularia spumigena]|uniref:caspase, EACC1-associated type n=1 Tax=Nodularia spumigena TaxID=70799 RepID=UPI00232ED5E4|nr:GUN4 domain-containing protein [Nodularia spumigena]MDB9316507.1 GUN4 domain-containing protein [Nodularia spumigena CS-590/01A]MDB9328480.1 GUN4 domain-containing protein [Nodularia spumigena CS-590/02]MDB9331996.1 GUN4 domain-containing protein [Nodularia spumigena CS-591/04]MDB9335182.1 GUN4 domain-containing protein [Nodularia spumigena CS-590/01]
MAKIALLIGVSEYGKDIPALSSPLNDVEAMQRVLQDPNLGGFEQVERLLNPDAIAMRKAIQKLFKEASKEDLILLFFSGHGITNDEGHLYLTTRETAKHDFEATAVDASFIQNQSNNCYAKRQVLILDACYSGAYAQGWRTKSVGVDIKQQLGAEGRVVLTSSSATQTSFEQEGSTLSLYTQYLVEGIESGAADKDNSGTIFIHELHAYAKEKVQAVKPKMTPDIILDKEGFNIIIANAPRNSEAEYRNLVEQYAQNGELSEFAYLVLKPKRKTFELTDEQAEEIENEVLEPFRRRLANLELYKQAFDQAVKQQYPLDENTLKILKDYQQDILGLRNEDVEEIEKEITSAREGEYQELVQKQQEAERIRQQQEADRLQTQRREEQEEAERLRLQQEEADRRRREQQPPRQKIDELSSDKGVDYTRLRDLLKAGKWKEADQETLKVMLKAAKREEEGWLDINSIEQFPCTDLRTIDQLWVEYSNGRFGFSVQKRIWESVGGNPEADYETWCKFGDRVGWRKGFIMMKEWRDYKDLTFNVKAPEGHLPVLASANAAGVLHILSRRDL